MIVEGTDQLLVHTLYIIQYKQASFKKPAIYFFDFLPPEKELVDGLSHPQLPPLKVRLRVNERSKERPERLLLLFLPFLLLFLLLFLPFLLLFPPEEA